MHTFNSYIYIYRERGIHMYTHMYVYIHIYIYIDRYMCMY